MDTIEFCKRLIELEGECCYIEEMSCRDCPIIKHMKYCTASTCLDVAQQYLQEHSEETSEEPVDNSKVYLKVKITVEDDSKWYSEHLGEVFEVEGNVMGYGNYFSVISNGIFTGQVILKDHCEVLSNDISRKDLDKVIKVYSNVKEVTDYEEMYNSLLNALKKL